jgi:hypothetical protein
MYFTRKSVIVSISIWMATHMACHNKGLVVPQVVMGDVYTMAQWVIDDIALVGTAAYKVGRDVFEGLDAWEYGSLEKFDLAPAPGVVADPDELQEWAKKLQLKAGSWFLCEMRTHNETLVEGINFPGDWPPSEDTTPTIPFGEPMPHAATHMCDVHLFKDSCRPKSWPDPRSGCWKRDRHLPNHIRRDLMVHYAPAQVMLTLHSIHEQFDKLYEDSCFKTKLNCETNTNSKLRRQRNFLEALDQLLATAGVSVLQPEFAIMREFKDRHLNHHPDYKHCLHLPKRAIVGQRIDSEKFHGGIHGRLE